MFFKEVDCMLRDHEIAEEQLAAVEISQEAFSYNT